MPFISNHNISLKIKLYDQKKNNFKKYPLIYLGFYIIFNITLMLTKPRPFYMLTIH